MLVLSVTSISLEEYCNDGNYALQPYVTKYVKCKNGAASIQLCKENEIFVPEKSSCLTTRESGFIMEFCRSRQDGSWVNPWYCHRWISCKDEVTANNPCPINTMVFDPDLAQCVPEDQYPCRELGIYSLNTS